MNIRMKVLVGTFATIGVLSSATMLTQAAFAQVGAAQNGWQKPTKPTATITPIQALKAATDKTKGGTAFQANFEFDEGKWVYGVLVVKGHKVTEVIVEPMSGKVLATEAITPQDEVVEVRDELTKIIKAGG